MMRRRAVSFGILSVLTLGAGLAAGSAAALARDVQPVPFDGKTGGPSYQQHGPVISCLVVGASCNKGPMPPWMGNGGRWDRGYSGRDGGMQQPQWLRQKTWSGGSY